MKFMRWCAPQKLWYVYKNELYCSVEGEVKNFEYIYENNSHRIRGVRFEVNNILFNINKGILNAEYQPQMTSETS